MEISNPRRVLAVSLEEEAHHLSKVIKELTGSNPQPASTSLAGTTHDLSLKTAYYTTTLPIWLDLISSPSDWAGSFLSEEAREVLSVLGGLVLVFSIPTSDTAAQRTRELVKHVGDVVKKGLGGWEWDGVGLAVGVGDGGTEEWDEACAGAGLEFVNVTGKAQDKKNEFGEKIGIPRVKEALESNDWAQLDEEGGLSAFGDFEDGTGKDGEVDDPENMDFGYDKADFEGLKRAIWENSLMGDDIEAEATSGKETLATEKEVATTAPAKDEDQRRTSQNEPQEKIEIDDDDVVRVERMMRKLQAVREAGEGMSEEQRKKMAARAVKEVMADLDDD
ncbi:hypothetical protein NLU13_9669 [Sarocladium strictum]|uniref:Increased recombination centers protein 6 n=1 Tax=Sarocladium strictum TaxID=5046 RepID=A0AA39GBN3_SARSR|nr:hypothetical protein NLU13_9669 [Sarocladium strictum]